MCWDCPRRQEWRRASVVGVAVRVAVVSGADVTVRVAAVSGADVTVRVAVVSGADVTVRVAAASSADVTVRVAVVSGADAAKALVASGALVLLQDDTSYRPEAQASSCWSHRARKMYLSTK